MITQEQISVVLKDLPGEFSIDELVDKLIFVEKINDAIRQGERGETYSTEEARELLRQWSK
jgi:Zn-dependent alcohol dehydrogenase